MSQSLHLAVSAREQQTTKEIQAQRKAGKIPACSLQSWQQSGNVLA